jgi:hypothetical protein
VQNPGYFVSAESKGVNGLRVEFTKNDSTSCLTCQENYQLYIKAVETKNLVGSQPSPPAKVWRGFGALREWEELAADSHK